MQADVESGAHDYYYEAAIGGERAGELANKQTGSAQAGESDDCRLKQRFRVVVVVVLKASRRRRPTARIFARMASSFWRASSPWL